MAKPSVVDSKVLNFNIGVLGHVDSGKTTLAKTLSTVASTASFDKHPQSQERGITLDLGFSSFMIPLPDHLKSCGCDVLQCTLVDCPGHASLIRTIIGGAQIIDLMMLVIDITKGIQTQTAECLVIGEIACEKMIVILNKIDQIEEVKREKEIAKMSKRISRTLETTKFKGVPIVPVAAKPGGEASDSCAAIGIDSLIKVLTENMYLPKRESSGPLIYAVDHCFGIRGQGTIMTGTILSGGLSLNDTIEIPSLKITKKVKSMQMFKQPVQHAMQGDRVAVCVTQFDPKQVERCIVCSPGHVSLLYGAVIQTQKIVYHKLPCSSGAKFHITIGHETVMGKCTFFGTDYDKEFNYEAEYHYLHDLSEASQDNQEKSSTAEAGACAALPSEDESSCKRQFSLIEFEKPVYCTENSLVIGSRLDTDAFAHMCRLVFYGKLLVSITDKQYNDTFLPRLKIFKHKAKEGVVERLHDECTVIGKGLFKKETKMDKFIGLKVALSTGEVGVIDGTFGTTGKFRVSLPDGLKQESLSHLSLQKKKKSKAQNSLQKLTS
ncbi:selenocysteine-specific elongation factor-like isoform X2 [Dysidea avara]|uniref:selenocysteine-specific elongation factor-like isoform X2 n=1 Tax=Dysidea avara TaxID=196820 RepID=UPI003316EB1B